MHRHRHIACVGTIIGTGTSIGMDTGIGIGIGTRIGMDHACQTRPC